MQVRSRNGPIRRIFMAMRARHVGWLAVTLVLAGPGPAAAQAAGAPPMSPEEAEAYQMGLEMSFVCNPQRHRSMVGSESHIQRGDEALEGTAALVPTAEGTFLVLEGYDEDLAGHCLVLAWFGGALEAGEYPIRRLAMSAMEEELDEHRHSFFAWSAVRAPEESSMLVTDSGSLRIDSMNADGPSGSFDLSGFVLEGDARTEDVRWEGTFTAVERDN